MKSLEQTFDPATPFEATVFGDHFSVSVPKKKKIDATIKVSSDPVIILQNFGTEF